MKKMSICFILIIISLLDIAAEGNRIIGTGPYRQYPGQHEKVRIVTHRDMSKAKPGDYLWANNQYTGGKWDWYYVSQGDIIYSKEHDFMAGFKETYKSVDENGTFTEYDKNENYSRRVYDSGIIEDMIEEERQFRDALANYSKIYNKAIPRRNNYVGGANNWYYIDEVSKDFPKTFWASIELSGEVMKVRVANGLGHKIAQGYWALPSLTQKYPNASWSVEGIDQEPDTHAVKIQSDPSMTYSYVEF
ncbi:MAG: hypothetical protein LBM77_04690 [Spirochaetaceae bacterium]|jgi:hypothetical protein|nr:hypothetical protein [Spirochaetaceae bacterium]